MGSCRRGCGRRSRRRHGPANPVPMLSLRGTPSEPSVRAADGYAASRRPIGDRVSQSYRRRPGGVRRLTSGLSSAGQPAGGRRSRRDGDHGVAEAIQLGQASTGRLKLSGFPAPGTTSSSAAVVDEAPPSVGDAVCPARSGAGPGCTSCATRPPPPCRGPEVLVERADVVGRRIASPVWAWQAVAHHRDVHPRDRQDGRRSERRRGHCPTPSPVPPASRPAPCPGEERRRWDRTRPDPRRQTPPWGCRNVLCRLRWLTSAPNSPGGQADQRAGGWRQSTPPGRRRRGRSRTARRSLEHAGSRG